MYAFKGWLQKKVMRHEQEKWKFDSRTKPQAKVYKNTFH